MSDTELRLAHLLAASVDNDDCEMRVEGPVRDSPHHPGHEFTVGTPDTAFRVIVLEDDEDAP